MVIKLRGHHLICLHFFRNGPESLKLKIEELLNRFEKDEDIQVVEGGDDICTSCPYFKNGVCTIVENAEEEVKEMDKKALELLNFKVGDLIKWKDIRNKILTSKEIVKIWYETYCKDCDFKNVCESEIKKYLS